MRVTHVLTTATLAGGGATTVKDYYQLGHLAYQTDGSDTLLATYTYDSHGTPVYVTLGLDPTSATTCYYYVYNAHGDVVNLVDATGNVVASYSYDTWGNLTSASETIPNANGWTNPYRYDGRDGVRYDASDGLYWMSVRAYDPTMGRFISHDPLGRAPLFFADQPYAYAGANPVSNVDPSGQHMAGASNSQVKQQAKQQVNKFRVRWRWGCDRICQAIDFADDKMAYFSTLAFNLLVLAAPLAILDIALDAIGALVPPTASVLVPVAGVIAAMGVEFGVLTGFANWISGRFSWNASWDSESPRWNNWNALERMRREIAQEIDLVNSVTLGSLGTVALSKMEAATQWVLSNLGWISGFLPANARHLESASEDVAGIWQCIHRRVKERWDAAGDGG